MKSETQPGVPSKLNPSQEFQLKGQRRAKLRGALSAHTGRRADINHSCRHKRRWKPGEGAASPAAQACVSAHSWGLEEEG